MKRKSPKALRQQQNKWGVVYTDVDDTQYNQAFFDLKEPGDITFYYDGGFNPGDKITIGGQSDDRSHRINHKNVHVARRRNAKTKSKPIVYEIVAKNATTITLKDGGTITCA